MVTRRQYSDNDKAAALAALDANGGNVKKTAEEIGIARTTIQNWMNERADNGGILPPAEEFSDKERLFIAYYLTYLNGTKAARLALYDGDDATLAVTAHRLLRNAKIRAEIDRILTERVMGMDEALTRLAEHARGDMADVADLSTVKDLQKSPHSRLIKKLKRRVEIGHNEDPSYEVVEIELYDAQSALVQIIKELHLEAGEPTDNHNVNITDAKQRLAHLINRRTAESGTGPDTEPTDG